mmetsp:Transcript_31083/g.91139  ORF Transcript_31083/g.91139 Transcript_31083/m.91139 type:complete len:336 (-) Transcript_31083:76-1083(-)
MNLKRVCRLETHAARDALASWQPRALSRRGARRRGEGGSQEVVWHARSEVGHLAQVLRPRLEDLKVDGSLDRDGEDGGDVAAAVAVVWRRPDGHQRVVEHVLVPLHHQLVRARDQVDRVGRAELGDHVAAKEVARASRRQPPPVDVLRVGPHQVAHRAVVRDLLLPVDDADLVEGVDGGGEAAVHAEDLVLDQRRERQVVEDLCAVPPDVDRAVLAQALVIKAVHLRDLPRLVVASDQGDAVRIPHLRRKTRVLGPTRHTPPALAPALDVSRRVLHASLRAPRKVSGCLGGGGAGGRANKCAKRSSGAVARERSGTARAAAKPLGPSRSRRGAPP